jgi:hypothetical protein
LLLALDGVPVGLVVEADTVAGWLRRYDTRGIEDVARGGPPVTGDAGERARRIAACPIVRLEGKVDFIGDTATDPDWMIAQRLVAVRIRHGLPIDSSLAHDTGGMMASVLERLASQLRSGSMTVTDLRMSCSSEPFPLPGGQVRHVRTGEMRLGIDYASIDGVREYEAAKAAWAKENPDLVAEHVRSLAEGESKIVEEAQALATHRIRTAKLHG